MVTEITYYTADDSVKTVDAGIFPSEGRYFRQKMSRVYKGFFSLEVSLPEGINYYQLFINENFNLPIRQSELKTSSHSDKEQLMIGSEVFFPVLFDDSSLYTRSVNESTQELRAISMQPWIEKISLVFIDNHLTVPFNLAYVSDTKKYWLLRHQYVPANPGYVLKVEGKGQTKYLHRDNQLQENINASFCFANEQDRQNYEPVFDVQGTGYQILPDRFAASGNREVYPYFNKWGDEPSTYSFFGGDLKGIIEKLPDLNELGIGLLYLNPIFESMSYHRYDCMDYFEIDHRLGDKADLENLIVEAHSFGIKVILDICINHCGSEHPFFQSVCEKGINSPYAEWFEIDRFPEGKTKLSYQGWQGRKELPQFNFESPEVFEYFCSVLQYWMGSFEIDGWRFDVSSEIPSAFLGKLFDKVKGLKPSVYLIGENWHNGYRNFVEEAGGTAITNFSNHRNIFHQNFTNKTIDVERIADSIFENIYSFPYQYALQSWNFLSNHDTSRFYGVLTNKRHYKNALALLFALPGVPIVYYGEENDMDGVTELSNRRTYQTGAPGPTRKWIKQLSKARREYALFFAEGELMMPAVGDIEKPTLVISYRIKKKKLNFYFNFSEHKCEIEAFGRYPQVSVEPHDFKIKMF